MRINRNAPRIILAATVVAALTIAPSFAQAPAGQPPAQPPRAGVAPGPGGTPAAAPEEPPTEAEKLIDQAIPKVAAVKAVSATLTQDVTMMGQSFQVKGRYLKAPGSRLLLRLEVAGLPGSTGAMVQVCNGDVLWNYQKILDSPSYSKLSVKPVLDRIQAPEVDKTIREQILSTLGFNGPEMLLEGVRKSIRFDQNEEGELDGRPVWILKGGWRDRAGLNVPEGRPVAQIGRLPAYVPSLATLTIDKENGWPYRLDLRGRPETMLIDTRPVGLDGQRLLGGSRKAAVAEKQDPSDLLLVYSDVKFDPTFGDADFAFQAPIDATVEDNTELLLQGLSRMIEAQAQQKRMEAAAAAPAATPVQAPPTAPATPAPDAAPAPAPASTPPR